MRRLHYTLLRLVSAVDRSVRERLTGAGKLAAISAFMAAIVGLDTHQSLASQVFALLAAMLAVSLLLSFAFRARVAVRRSLPRFATAGEELGYRISVSNAGRWPTSRCANTLPMRARASPSSGAAATRATRSATGSTARAATSAGGISSSENSPSARAAGRSR
jgi:hypothetical protein